MVATAAMAATAPPGVAAASGAAWMALVDWEARLVATVPSVGRVETSAVMVAVRTHSPRGVRVQKRARSYLWYQKGVRVDQLPRPC